MQTLNFSVMHEFLYFDKFEGTDLKHDKWFLKLQSQNVQIRDFLPPNYLCLIKLWVLKHCRVLGSNAILAFQNFSLKIPKQDFFGPKFGRFLFCTKLHFETFETADFKHGKRFFKGSV